ncbi:unnamed protein product [Protopolystoma xenopodis]|uniref:Dynein heavy chain tail domain-containing protein n=1 Tax=Protopolystoma xenopodis TaxID=117903 RepID=A0A448WRC2_9PLAT|nr:unnamed protein product [Protopolystoma xenopodis]
MRTVSQRYRHFISGLAPQEARCLSLHLARLRRVLQPGWSRLNWNSLVGRADYLNAADEALSQFATTLASLRKTAGDCEARMTGLDKLDVFRCPRTQANGNLPSCKEYFASLTLERQRLFDSLRARHCLIGPLLIGLESVITGAVGTGRHPQMQPYYEFWEQQLFARVYAVTYYRDPAATRLFAHMFDIMLVRHAGLFKKDRENTKMLVKEAGSNGQE